ncbi:MAG: type II secretion system F family protein [Candidatus Heimdallarchaeota archaeon]
MTEFNKIAMWLFSPVTEVIAPYFSTLILDLKRAGIKASAEEYISKALLISLIIFLLEFPFISIIIGILTKNFLFGFVTSFTISSFLTAFFFLFYINYPKMIIKDKAKEIDKFLPFAALHMATIASSKLALHRILEIFSKFNAYGELNNEIRRIVSDIKMFGIDVNTALEKGIERTPSKNFKELLWGLLSTNRVGGNLSLFLKEKSKSLMEDYRRKLYEFSHQLTVFIEVYLTAIILGAVFFVILTSIMSGLGGVGSNILLLQFMLIFIFLPAVSAIFIFIIRQMTPGGE